MTKFTYFQSFLFLFLNLRGFLNSLNISRHLEKFLYFDTEIFFILVWNRATWVIESICLLYFIITIITILLWAR